MKAKRPHIWLTAPLAGLATVLQLYAADPNPPPPALIPLSVTNYVTTTNGSTITTNQTISATFVRIGTNGQRTIRWTPYPASDQFKVLSTTNLWLPFAEDTNGSLSGYDWTSGAGANPAAFHRVQVTPMSSNDLFSATVLNRLTFGPTPDDIEHIKTVGPQTFIDEQLAFQGISESLDTDAPYTNYPTPPPPLTNWIRVSFTSTPTDTNFMIYLSGAGQVYVDDARLVLGTNANAGTNLLVNGDFEEPTLAPTWLTTSLTINSVVTNSPSVGGQAASGTNCLLLVCTATSSNAINNRVFQPFATNKTFFLTNKLTFSFSYLPVANATPIFLSGRLSGAPEIGVPLPTLPPAPPRAPPSISPLYAKLTNTVSTLDDFKAWTILHAVQSKRQLHEVMVQFFENHFSTQYQKTKDWFDNNYGNAITNDTDRQSLSVDFEFREHSKWRQLLLDPNCNFYDLLKVSVESPVMIIYLDTILSTRNAANENYAREILELHAMGADNGYIQPDIVDLAKIWTGWSVAKKDASVANNPFAPPVNNVTNDPGVWVLHFKTNSHNYTATKRLFTNNVVDPRFGPAFHGGQSYSLIITNNAYPGTNGMQEGYRVIQHLTEQPYVAEFISVKLCRLFVHENFSFGTYDYRLANLTPEAQLVNDCMTAWFTAAPGDGRHGNIRSLLAVIFNSSLFRGHGASQQKAKTPLEFAVSAVRALRQDITDGSGYYFATADTDGYGLTGGENNPLNRMGGMALFNKPEPDGYSEFGRIWLNTANLCERMRFAQHLLMRPDSGTKSSDYGTRGSRNVSDPVALLKMKLPATAWTNAPAIADYFIGTLFPGEGTANLALDRQAAIDFLNSNEAGVPANFGSLSSGSTAYDGRVRGMVALLMCLPRYQEQ